MASPLVLRRIKAAISVDKTTGKHAAENVKVTSTGVKSLDILLGGGVRTEQLTEFAGFSGTGKTQLCMSIAATNLQIGSSVHWIDILGAFRASRLFNVLHNRIGTTSDDEANKMMQRVLVSRAENAIQLLQLLKGLHESASKKEIVIIDSIGPILQELSHGSTRHHQGQALMVSIARMCKCIAKQHQCAVLITNNLSNSSRIMGGQCWEKQPHYRLLLEQQAGSENTKTYTISLQSATFFAPTISNFSQLFRVGSQGAF